MGEESPGSTKIRCQITSGEGDLRDSATENKPPDQGKGEKVREERTGFLVTKNAWKTPPGARPNRDDMALSRKLFLVSHPGWLLEAMCEFSPR